MGQLYCFSCGSALSLDEAARAATSGPVPICDKCKATGPTANPEDLRWMVRRKEDRVDGPLSRAIVIDRLARGILDPYTQVSRVNEAWFRLVEHPDFRACFIPGTPERLEVERAQQAVVSDRSAVEKERRRKVTVVAVCAVLGLGLPVLTTSTRTAVLPEAWMEKLTSAWGGVSGSVSRSVSSAVDQSAAEGAVAAEVALPATDAVKRLQVQWPKVDQPLSLLLTRGSVSLWSGTHQGVLDAQQIYEQAVALAPRDAEAVAGLALSYALTLDEDPDQVVTVVDLTDRADALSAGSVVALQARALAALLSKNELRARQIADECVAYKPADGGAAPPDPDPGCQAIASLAKGDAEGLRALDERLPHVTPVGIARAVLALKQRDYGVALRLARTLARRNSDDPTPYLLLSEAASALGEWREARDAAKKSADLAPYRLSQRALLGEILLKIDREPAAALSVLEAIPSESGWSRFNGRARVLSDAALAALDLGNASRGEELATLSLTEDAGNPAATLCKARALLAQDRASEIEQLLSSVDAARLVGREGARYYVGTARLQLAMGRDKAAALALDAALEADPAWAPASLERARAHLRAGNPAAAIGQIKSFANQDGSLDADRDPLVAVWYPEPGWNDLRAGLEEAASKDVRLTPSTPTALGVLAWASDQAEARTLLERAIREQEGSLEAHGALAQILVERGEPGAALPHIERVLAGDPRLGVYQALRGRALVRLGKADAAAEQLEAAMVSAKNEPLLYRARAEVRLRKGDLEGAKADLEHVLSLVPDHLEARRALVDLQGGSR